LKSKAIQKEKTVEETPGLMAPFCEANLSFVSNETTYSLHPKMPIGETVYIERAP
jgi:hypothetical protein